MAKKTYVDVIGLKKGVAPEIVGTFSTRSQANWHINNTFNDLGYDNLLTKQTTTKGETFIQDTVADDRESYVRAVSTMKIIDMDTVETVTGRDTLLGYINKGYIKNKSGLGKIDVLESEDNSDDLEELKRSVQYIYAEKDAFPLSKIEKKLTNELLNALSGEDVSDTPEEDEEEEKTEDTPKKEIKTKKEQEKAEDIKEDKDEKVETIEDVGETEEEVEEVATEEETEADESEEDDSEELEDEETVEEEIVESEDENDVEDAEIDDVELEEDDFELDEDIEMIDEELEGLIED